MTDRGHHFDGVGVCIYCGECDDEVCCPDTVEPCSRKLLPKVREAYLRTLQWQRPGWTEGQGDAGAVSDG